MSDIDTRAQDAQALKDNPYLEEILKQIEDEAHRAWIGTMASDQQAREFAWMLAKAAGRVRVVIQGAIDDQRIAASRATAPLR